MAVLDAGNHEQSLNNCFRSLFFPPEGNFDIDARDGGGEGGGWGTNLKSQNHKTNPKKSFVRKLFTLLGHILKKSKRSQNLSLKYLHIYINNNI